MAWARKGREFEHKTGPSGNTGGLFYNADTMSTVPSAPSAPDLSRPPGRAVIVVLGAGRSGTSLLMQVLAALGMAVSERLIGAGRDNPRGHFEDAPIVRIQADLLRRLDAWPYHPLPPDWLDHPATATAEQALEDLLRPRLGGQDEASAPWGFKDPRTAAFLPMWQRLFDRLGIAPRYLLALRDPGSVVQSFMAAYGAGADEAESVWLRRTGDALWHTEARCHLVHYEDWFRRPAAMAADLARFAGLAAPDPARLSDLLAPLIRPELDRSGRRRAGLANAEARALARALEDCRGDDFDRNRLLERVAERVARARRT